MYRVPTQYASDSKAPGCPVCGVALQITTAKGRKSGKPFLMLVCPKDGRHFRGFINDRDYVAQVLERLEGRQPQESAGQP